MAARVIVHSRERPQEIELRAGHIDSSHEHGPIQHGNVVVFCSHKVVDEGQTKGGQILGDLIGQFLIITIVLQRLRAKKNHVLSESPVPVLCENGLGYIHLVLLIETLSMLDGCKRPFIDMELKVL